MTVKFTMRLNQFFLFKFAVAFVFVFFCMCFIRFSLSGLLYLQALLKICTYPVILWNLFLYVLRV